MQPLLSESGKVAFHGRTAASPGGCAGRGEPPLRERSRSLKGGSTVVGFKPGQDGPTADPGPDAEPEIEVKVVLRSAREPAPEPPPAC
jgi:hypothetical protein